MQDAFRVKLASYGRWTYRGAWALEISAALIGLATGLVLGYQAFSNSDSGSVTSVDLALASAPFIMVAIAELTKIPIATLLFSSSWLWKPIVFLFLLALAAITFETVFMGLERAATLRQLKYEEMVTQIQGREYERAQIAGRITDAQSLDVLKKARENFELILLQAEQERTKLEQQTKEIEKDLEGQRTILPGAARLRDAIAEKNIQLGKLIGDRDTQIKVEFNEFEHQRDSFVDRIKSARSSGDIDATRRYEDEVARLANPRRKIEQQFQTRISLLEAEISALRGEFDRLQANATPMTVAQRQQLNAKRDDQRRRLDLLDGEWESKRSAARKQMEDAQAIEATKQSTVQNDQLRKDEISSQLSALESRRVELARTDQIRRIAARFYGVRPEAVTDDQSGFVSVMWFGSLAMLAALAGPLTAVVALSLQRIGLATSDVSSPTKLQRLVRRMLLNWRWRRVRIVEKKVEVTVEKVVEKIVEVPIERVVKEILYVPVLTDDPEAIKKAMSDTLPKEVADLVSVNFKGKRNAGAA